MPSPKKSNGNRAKFAEKKSMSFHGRGGAQSSPAADDRKLWRPRTVPDLISSTRTVAGGAVMAEMRPKLTKLLLNVTIQGSLGAVQVLMAPEMTVGDLIKAAVRQYVKEGRRPVLPTSEPSDFDLHYSQFSLESLDREETLVVLGSRNFFLCKRKVALAADDGSSSSSNGVVASCSKEAEKPTKNGLPFPWLKFMQFML